MASELRRRPNPVPALFDWVENFPFGPRAFSGEHAIRVEEYEDGDTYTVKAELPGVDPARDIEITVEQGMLTVHAERSEEKKEGKRSEFAYGSFTRSVVLPEGVKAEEIKANYDNGVLTVTAPTGRGERTAKKIPVSTSS